MCPLSPKFQFYFKKGSSKKIPMSVAPMAKKAYLWLSHEKRLKKCGPLGLKKMKISKLHLPFSAQEDTGVPFHRNFNSSLTLTFIMGVLTPSDLAGSYFIESRVATYRDVLVTNKAVGGGGG